MKTLNVLANCYDKVYTALYKQKHQEWFLNSTNIVFIICSRWISAPSDACFPSSSAWTWTCPTKLEVRKSHLIFFNMTAWGIAKHFLRCVVRFGAHQPSLPLKTFHQMTYCISFPPFQQYPIYIRRYCPGGICPVCLQQVLLQFRTS